MKDVETWCSTNPDNTVRAKVTCHLSDTSNKAHFTSPLFPLSTFICGKILRKVPLYMSRLQRFMRGLPRFLWEEKSPISCFAKSVWKPFWVRFPWFGDSCSRTKLLKIHLSIRSNKILLHHFFLIQGWCNRISIDHFSLHHRCICCMTTTNWGQVFIEWSHPSVSGWPLGGFPLGFVCMCLLHVSCPSV